MENIIIPSYYKYNHFNNDYDTKISNDIYLILVYILKYKKYKNIKLSKRDINKISIILNIEKDYIIYILENSTKWCYLNTKNYYIYKSYYIYIF